MDVAPPRGSIASFGVLQRLFAGAADRGRTVEEHGPLWLRGRIRNYTPDARLHGELGAGLQGQRQQLSQEVSFLLESPKLTFEREVLSGEVEQLDHDLPALGDAIPRDWSHGGDRKGRA
jgi:hypothetical protein